ncbi:hypothetical protein ACNO5E_26310 [Vibrio parahaemolyticus]|uniref:hypothetical protein n=1 Tax=Vibrio parahaemolyticus TaxID=670 RepID=UPI0008138CBA|nr:hypothetical protein [Vibrio parahaemolyticus]OCP68345.1 hypothetical protein AKH08_16145 [Vibrio parahaemolyticus]
MRKADYATIAKGLAQFDHEHKVHSKSALHPGEAEQGLHFQRYMEMDDAYMAELARLADADQTATQRAYQRHEAEALGQHVKS